MGVSPEPHPEQARLPVAFPKGGEPRVGADPRVCPQKESKTIGFLFDNIITGRHGSLPLHVGPWEAIHGSLPEPCNELLSERNCHQLPEIFIQKIM